MVFVIGIEVQVQTIASAPVIDRPKQDLTLPLI